MSKKGDADLSVQTSNYKMRMFWGSDVQHGNYGKQYCIVYLKVAKGTDFKYSLHKKVIK